MNPGQIAATATPRIIRTALQFCLYWLLAMMSLHLGASTLTNDTPSNLPVIFTQDSDHLKINDQAFYFEDKSQSSDSQWVIDDHQRYLFNPLKNKEPNQGYTESAIWSYFQIQNQQQQEDLYLEVGHPLLNIIELYVVQNGELIQSQTLGSDFPFDTREIKNPNFIFPLKLKTGQTYSIYIRVLSSHSTSLSLNLYSRKELINYTYASSAISFSYFGVMLGIFFYNLFLFAFIKTRAYLYYAAYLTAVIFHQATVMGLAMQYLWPESPHFTLIAPNLFAALTIATSCEFARNFLRVKEYSIVLNRGFIFLELGLALALPLWNIISPMVFSQTLMMLTVLSFIWILASAIYVLSHGFIIARFFLLGWGVLFTFLMIYIAYLNNFLPHNGFTFYAVQIGSSIEAIILSIALADRINIMRKEKLELQKLTVESLEKNNQLKDQFLATISHELRTPIHGIQGALQLISMNNPNKQTISYVGMANLSTNNMLDMVENILQFSEAQSGKLALREEPVALTDLLNSVISKFKQPSLEKGLTLTHFYDETIDGLWKADQYLLKKALNILLENALKFTHKGSIHLQVDLSTPEQQSPPRHIVFTVTDSGIGIPSEQIDTIFKPFHQVDSSFSRRYTGLGIGLAVFKEVVALMGGKIQVTSKPEHGSKFSFSIPLIALKSTDTDTPLNTDHQQNSKEKHKPLILVVEDNRVNKSIMESLLKNLGCTVMTADDGAEALILLKNEPIELIFMDCQMPIMDGFTATREIRQSRLSNHNIPIVAVTANANSADKERCLQSGMTGYLVKPVTLRELKSALNQHLKTKL